MKLFNGTFYVVAALVISFLWMNWFFWLFLSLMIIYFGIKTFIAWKKLPAEERRSFSGIKRSVLTGCAEIVKEEDC